jgi:hypothetical protein
MDVRICKEANVNSDHYLSVAIVTAHISYTEKNCGLQVEKYSAVVFQTEEG